MTWLLSRIALTGAALTAIADQLNRLADAIDGWSS